MSAAAVSSGALAGLKIVEMEGIGPGPFAGMMLADHGAEVIRIARPGVRIDPSDVLARSRSRVELDLKSEAGRAAARALIRDADGLIEGYRPGVMERLGLGPEVLLADNPKLVYGRMTGWGQEGPLAHAAGHDINYIAITGALNAFGRRREKPTPPINMVGDFGGGGMLLGQKISDRVAKMRNLPKGIDQRSACRHPDWTGPDDLEIKILEIREITGWEKPIYVKIGGARPYYDTTLAVKAGADVVVLDGMQGGTAATQDVFIEHVGQPTLAALPQAVKALQDMGMHRKVQLIISGGIRNHKPEIMYKAFELAGYPNSKVDKRFGGMVKAF